MKGFLIGFPDDLGVKNVNGRIGAAIGPFLFRKFFQKFETRNKGLNSFTDLGDIKVGDDIHLNHTLATEKISEALRKGGFFIAIGGGHDYVFPILRAMGLKNSGCINIDPHFDLRPFEPKFTSGSGFNAAISKAYLKGENLAAFGIQEHCNSSEAWRFAEDQKIQVVTFDDLRSSDKALRFRKILNVICEKADHIFLSLDLDSFQAAFAPGVSAPAAEGFNPSEVIEMVKIAGEEEQVKGLGIFELNPIYDQDDRTARLAAILAFQFILSKNSQKVPMDFLAEHRFLEV